jgi:hypothetical protein
LKEKGIPYNKGKFPFTASGSARAAMIPMDLPGNWPHPKGG